MARARCHRRLGRQRHGRSVRAVCLQTSVHVSSWCSVDEGVFCRAREGLVEQVKSLRNSELQCPFRTSQTCPGSRQEVMPKLAPQKSSRHYVLGVGRGCLMFEGSKCSRFLFLFSVFLVFPFSFCQCFENICVSCLCLLFTFSIMYSFVLFSLGCCASISMLLKRCVFSVSPFVFLLVVFFCAPSVFHLISRWSHLPPLNICISVHFVATFFFNFLLFPLSCMCFPLLLHVFSLRASLNSTLLFLSVSLSLCSFQEVRKRVIKTHATICVDGSFFF